MLTRSSDLRDQLHRKTFWQTPHVRDSFIRVRYTDSVPLFKLVPCKGQNKLVKKSNSSTQRCVFKDNHTEEMEEQEQKILEIFQIYLINLKCKIFFSLLINFTSVPFEPGNPCLQTCAVSREGQHWHLSGDQLLMIYCVRPCPSVVDGVDREE